MAQQARDLKLQARDLKTLLGEIGRLRPLRDPISRLDVDLTPPQVHCLLWLGTDGPLPLNVVAARIGCGQPSVTGVVDRLEKLGYVERERDTADRRVVRVKLTESGVEVARVLDETMIERIGQFLSLMPPEDRKHALRILGVVVDKLRAAAVQEAS